MTSRTVGRLPAPRALLARVLPGALLVVVLTPTPLFAAGGGEAPSASLFGLNLGLMFWTIAVFVILLLLLRWQAWGPIQEQLQAREDRIQNALDDSAQQRAEAARMLDEHKRQLADAHRQAQDIVAQGRTAAEKVKREIEEKARSEGEHIIENARREIERERDAALSRIRAESVDLALAAASKLMHERMDAQSDRELVEGYLDGLPAPTGREAGETHAS